MYLGFYGLGKAPFHVTPDPEFLFLSPSHKEAYASIVYGVSSRKGFLTLTGEVGTGKTTILRAYLRQMKDSDIRAIYLFNPDITFEELLRLVLHEMGMEGTERPAAWMLQWLHWALVQEYREGHNVVLVIDEAQNMPVETLEKLRMLSNVETAKDKLLQIVLVGQPELDVKLGRHELRQLQQRIAIHATLRELTFGESIEYIRHRIAQADGYYDRVFTPAAAKTLARYARGNPRVLNILCDNALVAGFGYQRRPVTVKIVREVIGDYGGVWRSPYLRWVSAAAAGCVVVGGIMFAPWDRVSSAFRHEAVRGGTPSRPAFTGNAQGKAATAAPAEQKPPAPVVKHSDVSLDMMLKSIPERYSRVIPPEIGGKTDLGPAAPAPSVAPGPSVAPVVPQGAVSGGAAGGSVEVSVPASEGSPALASDAVAKDAKPSADTPVGAELAEVRRTVKLGDCLTSLITDVYGYCNDSLIAQVKMRNPQIRDIDYVLLGDTLVFPNAPSQKAPKAD